MLHRVAGLMLATHSQLYFYNLIFIFNYLKSKVMKKSVWKQILQIFITVATSIISALGVTSCVAHI